METKHYFEKINAAHTTMVLYGPFATIQEARRASFFSRDANEFHKDTKRNADGRWSFRTAGYDDNEILSITQDPECVEYKKVTVKARATLHASWRRFPADFRARYFADSYKIAFGVDYE
jgi:hypothetical protein